MDSNHKPLERCFPAESGSGERGETLVKMELAGILELKSEALLRLVQARKIVCDEMLPIDNRLEDAFHTIEPRGAVVSERRDKPACSRE